MLPQNTLVSNMMPLATVSVLSQELHGNTSAIYRTINQARSYIRLPLQSPN